LCDTKGGNSLSNQGRDRIARLAPWFVSLGLHVAAILLFWTLRAPKPIHRPEVMQVLLAPPDKTPQFFSELPPDRADKAPEKPELLSNVTSRARDRVPGGTSDIPRMRGEGDVPTVKLAPEGGSSRAPAQAAPQPAEPGGVRAAESRVAQKGDGKQLVQVPEAALRGSPGSSANEQPEMAHPEGNASLLGDVSLNTVAWDYAPWLQRFCERLRERWFAPPAYMMGILKDGGFALIEVEISRDGKLLRLDLLDEQGHPSLIHAAQAALRAIAPVEPLPADFPEPTLILRIRMTYPRVP